MRHHLDHTQERLADLHKTMERYVGPSELPEPDQDEVAEEVRGRPTKQNGDSQIAEAVSPSFGRFSGIWACSPVAARAPPGVTEGPDQPTLGRGQPSLGSP